MPHFPSLARKLFFIFIIVIVFAIPLSLSVLDCAPSPVLDQSPSLTATADSVNSADPVNSINPVGPSVTIGSSATIESVASSASSSVFVSPASSEPAGSSETDEPQYFSSFAYSSVNFYLEDSAIRFDNDLRGLSFYPDVETRAAASRELDAAAKKYLSEFKLNPIDGSFSDRRCLGDNCLEQEGPALSYNGEPLALPAGVKEADIAVVSIAALKKIWLIGFTLQDGENYRGRAFSFDGRTMAEIILPAPVTSRYRGIFGFGGEDNDFLVLYSADQGTAYRIKTGQFTEAINISRFFNIRGQSASFKAEAIKVASGREVDWYIFSSTLSRPRLLKLWQNRTTEIVGAISFENFPGSQGTSAVFKKLSFGSGEIRLAALVRDGSGRDDWQIFADRGFKNNSSASLLTVPLGSLAEGGQFRIVSIAHSALEVDASGRAAVKWLFSSDHDNWRAVPLGRNLEFEIPLTGSYFFRLDFSAASDKFFSPFIGAIFFDYYFQK
ncbi:MAG: hypothetical protein WC456_00845 [Patescibacteria group bacterium]